jgi:factor associated with neutral sphingomyelinase activation
MLTDVRLYLQPLNNIDPEPVQKYAFHTFVSIYKRRHTLRHTGLEILMQNDASLFLSFKTYALRLTSCAARFLISVVSCTDDKSGITFTTC